MALALVMGIPGAGKTTLCKKLEKLVGEPCRLFSFDDIFNDNDFMRYLWTDTDKHESLLQVYGLENQLSARAERKRCEETVRNYLREWGVSHTRVDGECTPHVTLVDDLFYLRSMRRPFRRMCRAFRLAYIVILVDTPLDQAVSNNSRRPLSQQIPAKTIQKVSTLLEIPRDMENLLSFRPDDDVETLAQTIRRIAAENCVATPTSTSHFRYATGGSREERGGDNKFEKLELDLRRCVGELFREKKVDPGSGAALAKAKKDLALEMRLKNAELWEYDVLKDIIWQRAQGVPFSAYC